MKKLKCRKIIHSGFIVDQKKKKKSEIRKARGKKASEKTTVDM